MKVPLFYEKKSFWPGSWGAGLRGPLVYASVNSRPRTAGFFEDAFVMWFAVRLVVAKRVLRQANTFI